MPVWNRDVSLGDDENLVVSLSAQHPNPPDHPNDTANEMTVSAKDFDNQALVHVVYHAIRPNNNNGTVLTVEEIVPDPDRDCAGDVSELTQRKEGDNLSVRVKKGIPHADYCYLIKAYVQVCDAHGECVPLHLTTSDPVIHNQTPGGPLPK